MIPFRVSFACVLFVVIQYTFASLRVSPIVNTSLGQIRGLRADDGDYYMYMGIPYAQVNRSNVFGKAVSQEPFDEVFDAFDDSAICPQIEEFNNTIVGTLDCLHINVYTPTTANSTNLLPVMVMIYGGAFEIGFAGRYMYGPKFLVRHDVILVTFNYRLGPYGFMCLNTPEVPGNEGLKDQLMALRWIKENIEAFGGDPNGITALGNSAGGQAVVYHLVSRMEKVFKQSIIQSGPFAASTSAQSTENAPMELAAFFGFDTDDINEAITFLSGVSEYDIINATAALELNFGICIEYQFDGVEAFLAEDWLQAPMPKATNMPILMGITNREALAVGGNPTFFTSNNTILNLVGDAFQADDPAFEGMAELVHRFYMGDEPISVNDPDRVIDFFTDYRFVHTKYRDIKTYQDNEVGDLFFYKFSYVGNRNFVRFINNITIETGATHADELGYLYDMAIMTEPPSAADQLIIDRITTLWTNFAKHGNPTPEQTELIPLTWEPLRNDSSIICFNIDTELSIEMRPFYSRMAFWDLFYEVNSDLQITPSSSN